MGKELKKVMTNKLFYIGLFVLMLINSVVFFAFCNDKHQGGESYKSEEYRKLWSDLEGMSQESALKYLESEMTNVYAHHGQTGKEFRYTGDYYKESALIDDFLLNYKNCENYSTLVTEKLDHYNSLLTFGMSGVLDKYQADSMKKKAERMAALTDITVKAGPSKGIEKVLQYRVVDFAAIGFLVLIVVILFTNERDHRMLVLYKTTRKGRDEFILSKLAACILFSMCAIVVFWGFILLYAKIAYGFGDINRSIQSVNGMEFVPYKVTILEYLCLSIGFKYLYYLAIMLFVLLVSVCSSNSLRLYSFILGGFGAGVLLYNVIPENSYAGILKYVNLFSPVYSIDFMNNYRNINVFGLPIPIMPVLTVVMLVVILILGYLVWMIFTDQKEAAKISIKSRKMSIRTIFGYHTNSFFHEFYKVMINGKVIIVLTGFAIFSVFTYKTVDQMFLVGKDYYEEFYLDKLRGRVDDSKLKYLEEEKNRFEEIEVKLAEAESNGNDVAVMVYAGQLTPYQSFMRIYNEITPHLVSVDGDYFDTDGGELLTVHKRANNKHIVLAIIFSAITIFPLAYIFTQDYQCGMNTLVTSTYNGKKKTLRNKIILAVIVVLIAYLINYLPYYIAVFSKYGCADMEFKARSMEHLENLADSFSVGGYFVFINAMRIVGMVLVILLSAILGKYVKNVVNVMLILAVILIFPLLFAYFDMPGAKFYGFNPFLIGNLCAI